MISSIIDNLTITFRCSGENANEQIQESEEALLNLSLDSEFYPSLFQIISSDEIPTEIRKAALIYLQFLIKNWTNSLSEEAKVFIIENFPSLLENCFQFLGLCLKLSENLVKCTFFAGNQWPSLLEIIFSGFENFETEKSKTFSSIILLNAISRHFKRKSNTGYNEFYPFLHDFILFTLTNILNEEEEKPENFSNFSNFLPFTALCYQTMIFFNWNDLSPYFKENVDDFNELLLQTTQIANFERMNCSIEEFIYFSKQAIKFSAKMINNYQDQIKEDVSIQILISLYDFFSQFHDNEIVLRSVARLIHSFLSYEPTYQFIIENNFSNFVIKLIFPFYYLNEQDIEDSKNNPIQFLAKFQTENFIFESESRAYLYQTIVQKSSDLCRNKKEEEENEFPQFCFTIFQIFVKVVENYLNQESVEGFQYHKETDDALIFSILFLFSSINPSFPYFNEESSLKIINLLSQLFESSSHLIISGVLFCIKSISSSFSLSCSCCESLFPPEYYIQTMEILISHPSQLVRYYAGKTFYEIIKQAYRSDCSNEEEQNESQINSILESCAQFLADILKSYFEIAVEFDDFEFIELLTDVMTVFSSSLISDASQLICQVFGLFLNYQDSANSSSYSNNPNQGDRIIDSLFQFIKEIFERNSEIPDDEIITPLLEFILQVLTEPNSLDNKSYHIIFEFIAKLSFLSSFNFNSKSENKTEPIFPSQFSIQIEKRNNGESFSPIFWKFYEIIPQIIDAFDDKLVEDGIFAMRSILISNSEVGINEEILSFSIQLCEKYLSQFLNDSNDQVFSTMIFLATIFVIAPPESLLNIEEIYRILIITLSRFFKRYDGNWPFSSNLFISMMFQNSNLVFETLKNCQSLIIEENLDDENEKEEEEEEYYDFKDDFIAHFCMEWIKISDAYLQMLFIMNFNEFFSQEANVAFIQKVLMTLENSFESFDFSSDEQKFDFFFNFEERQFTKKFSPCSLLFFDSYLILDNFTQFMQSISDSVPELTQRFNEIMNMKNSYLNDENEEDFDDDDLDHFE